MAKSWGGAGAWAVESELAESQQGIEDPSYPSLGAAASSKPKKKHTTVTLSEFNVGKFVGPGSRARGLSESKGLTTEDMMMLPTGPRDRSGEEVQPFGGLGGGFKDYGAYRGGRDNSDRDREGGGNRGGFGGDREWADEPSRADGSDNWGASKKFVPPSGGSQRFEDDRRRGGWSSDRDLVSKADEDDHWGSSKKVVAPNENDRRGAGRYEEYQTRVGSNDSYGFSRADDVDNWGSSKKFGPSAGFDASQRGKDFGFGRDRDSGADADKWSRREPSQAAFSERPRLVLQPRTRPLDSSPPPASREEIEIVSPPPEEPKASPAKRSANPFGEARPREQVLSGKNGWTDPLLVTDGPVEVAPKPRKVNPFGAAKPREVILEEKGMDWKTLNADMERRSADRPETEEERVLKDQIKALQEAIKSGEAQSKGTARGISAGGEDDQSLSDLRGELATRERDLEQLTGALNDKIRFARVGGERPPSRSGNRENERESDTWTKSNGNGQPQAERKGGRW